MHHRISLRWLGILAVVVVAAILRLHYLDFESLFMDEIHQVSYYPNNMVQLVSDAARQQQPPLDYWIGHLVSKISYSDFTIRLPSAVFGIASVLMMILIIERSTSLTIALFAGLIAGLMPYHIYFSQHARPYSISIFFLLALIVTLRNILTMKRVGSVMWLLFFAIAVCFLYSRALAPLVVVSGVAAISIGLLALSYHPSFSEWRGIRGRLGIVSGICTTSILVYLPVFFGILRSGSRYAREQTLFDPATLLSGWEKLDLLSMLKAIVVQMEPIGGIVILLAILSLLLGIHSRFLVKHIEILYIAALLVFAGVLHLFIFQSKTDLPFRPPYAIYAFPFVTILAAVGVSEILERTNRKNSLYVNRISVLVGVLLVVYTAVYTVDFKSTRKVSDWRGLTQYLMAKDLERHFFVFDSLSSYGNWEPIFYGFPRYSSKRFRGTSIAATPEFIDRLMESDLRPVFVLFHYREYRLTSSSRFYFHPRPKNDQDIDFTKLENDPMLSIKKFTSFHVVEPAISSGSLTGDMLFVLDRLLQDLTDSSGTAELHIAAAFLNELLNLPNAERHAAEALALVPQVKRDEVMSKLGKLADYGQ